jgi:hypothetical protein
MDKVLVDDQVSKELELKIEFKGGDLLLSAVYAGKGVGAQMGVNVSPDYFLDQLKLAIPGQIDDAIIDVLKAAFKV